MDKPENKTIDKEHVVIEKIFRITLDPEGTNNFYYLEDYHAILLSSIEGEKNVLFRIKNLEDMMLSYLFQHEEVKNDVLKYLLVTYHRAIVMIEKK